MAGQKLAREEREKQLLAMGPNEIRRIYREVVGEEPLPGIPMIQSILHHEYQMPANP